MAKSPVRGTLRQPQDVVWADTGEKIPPTDPRALTYRQLSAQGAIDTSQPAGSLRNPSVVRQSGDEGGLSPGAAYLDIGGQLQFAPVSTRDIETEEFGLAPPDQKVRPARPLMNSFQYAINPSERSRVDTITRMYPGREFSRDPNGRLVVRVSPTSPWYYLNKPGVSEQDVADTVMGVAAFAPAGLAARGAKTAMQAGMRIGAASSATSAVQDLASGQPVDPAKATMAGLGGLAGEFVGQGIGAVVRGSGRVAANAMPAPARNLLDNVSDRVGRSFGADARAATAGRNGDIPLTAGEASKDFNQIAWEQAAAHGARGQEAGDVMRGFLGQRAETVAARGRALAGSNALQLPSEAAAVVQGGMRGRAGAVKSATDEAYTAARAGNEQVTSRTVAALPGKIQAALDDAFISPQDLTSLNPRTARIYKEIERLAGGAPKLGGHPASGWSMPVAGLERVRQGINLGLRTAQGNDWAALMIMKREFDTWLDEAVNQSLATGGKDAISMWRKARGLHRGYRETFGGGQGRQDGAQKMMQQLIRSDANETDAVGILFGRAELSGAGDSVALIRRIRAASPDGPEWAALREGSVMRLMGRMDRNAGGGTLNINYKALADDWTRALDGPSAPLMRELFTPAEIREMRRYVGQLRRISPPQGTVNRSGSGYEAARAFNQLMGKLKILAPVIKAMDDASNATRAQAAINPAAVQPRLPGSGLVGGAAGAQAGGPKAMLEDRYRAN